MPQKKPATEIQHELPRQAEGAEGHGGRVSYWGPGFLSEVLKNQAVKIVAQPSECNKSIELCTSRGGSPWCVNHISTARFSVFPCERKAAPRPWMRVVSGSLRCILSRSSASFPACSKTRVPPPLQLHADLPGMPRDEEHSRHSICRGWESALRTPQRRAFQASPHKSGGTKRISTVNSFV